MQLLHNLYNITAETAPWLLIGFLLAGLLHVLLPVTSLTNKIKGKGPKAVVLSSLIGLPLPLCSCGVLPVAMTLRKSGASKGATASFLVSTPEVGVDSALLSYGLLGLPFTILRVIASLVSALLTGIFVDLGSRFGEEKSVDISGSKKCCAFPKEHTDSGLFKNQIFHALHYGFVTIPRDLAKVLLFGIVLSAVAATYLPDLREVSTPLSNISQMLMAIVASIPVYVCSVSATPLAAALLLSGVYPGAVLVFLLCGPATNIATILAVKKMLGLKESFIYVSSIILISFLFGIGFGDMISFDSLESSVLEHRHANAFDSLLVAALSILIAAGLFIKPKGCHSCH